MQPGGDRAYIHPYVQPCAFCSGWHTRGSGGVFPPVQATVRCVLQRQTGTASGLCRLDNLSARARERMLHTNCSKIPLDWHIGPDGFILPEDYVAVKSVEALYRSPKRMNYFLVMSSKARKKLASEDHLPAFRDQTILAALPDLCRSLFEKDTFLSLSEEEQREFMRQIRFRFSADVNQIARVCGLSYSGAARLIDGY